MIDERLRMIFNERRDRSIDPSVSIHHQDHIKAQRRWPIVSRFFFDTLYIRARGEGAEAP